MPEAWQIWIDTGGTFTDCIALDPAGTTHRLKVLSSGALTGRVTVLEGPSSVRYAAAWTGRCQAAVGMTLGGPEAARVVGCDSERLILDRPAALAPGQTFELNAGEAAPILAARLATGCAVGDPLPPIEMRLGTTLATNALLEMRIAPVAFFVTAGFADLLDIGTQQRPDLFALRIVKPAPLHAAVIEVTERVAADGAVLTPLDPGTIEARARRILDRGVRVAAVALINAWANPEHERALATFLRLVGFEHVSCSCEMAAGPGLLARAQTAVVNAALAPVVNQYLTRIVSAIGRATTLSGHRQPQGVHRPHEHPIADPSHRPDAPCHAPPLLVMTSAGGLVRPENFRAKDSLLSGPAGGVVGAAWAGRRAGFDRVISFDMGGTSTDVARLEADAPPDPEHEVAGVRILAPAVAVESVAAGGGSICRIDRGELCVGPRSAGADPGPACYGRGGPLTLTDANLLLGRLRADSMGIPIDESAARSRAAEMLPAFGALGDSSATLADMLVAFIDVADERMADAVRQVSARRGYDPRDYPLVAFGGAGGQHACGVASRLGISTVLVPADAGLLSAAGVGAAPIERTAERAVMRTLDELGVGLDDIARAIREEACRLAAEEAPAAALAATTFARMRLLGQESALALPFDSRAPAAALFAERYAAVYGHPPPPRPIEVVSVFAVARAGPGRATDEPAAAAPEPGPVLGPALIARQFTTIVVPVGWTAEADGAGAIVLRAAGAAPCHAGASAAVAAELAINRLGAIAREMGEVVRRTAISVNVRDRLDFSCALLDAGGELIVNAPHVPVHLGALGVCVRTVAAALTLRPGDVAVTNHPAFGGSHLPDVTVITPVFADRDSSASGPEPTLLGYAATRAHHAEIGGISPGSMSPAARSLADEGVVIPPMLLVAAGDDRSASIEELLRRAQHPSRAVAENLADLRAAIAANRLGADAMAAVARAGGPAALRGAMERLKERSADRLGEALMRRGDADLTTTDCLDDGTPIAVRFRVRAGRAEIDFDGSGGVHPGNLNAPPAVVRSAVVYVLRLLVGEEMPLNEGLMRRIDLRVPPGILAPLFDTNPTKCPAVAAGNTETSQRIVDVLLAALGYAAASQGTMNNVVFGNERFGYYETICGGSGAGPGFDGAHCVHTHMTNTRITDPEVLERRYPVRLVRFARRHRSGGAGAHRGGDGVVREIEFLEPVTLSILSQRRTTPPPGAAGGSPGACGAQRLVRSDGSARDIASIETLNAAAGSRLAIETPGGGGWGAP